MAELNSQPPASPQEDPEKVERERTKGKLIALGSGAGCLVLATIPVSLFIIFGIGYYLVRGCAP